MSIACSGGDPYPGVATGGTPGATTGGSSTTGGVIATGGTSATGGSPALGGSSSSGGNSTGGSGTSGGSGPAQGGASTGGFPSTGGSANGGQGGSPAHTGGASGSGSGGSGGSGQGSVSFEQVEVIVGNNCVGCHVVQKPIFTTTGAALHNTLVSTVVKQCGNHSLVSPGNAANSAIIELVTNKCNGFRMPTSCSTNMCLVEEEFAAITSWIAAGAKGP